MQNWFSFQTYCIGLATETRISPDSRRCWRPRCFCAKTEANTTETFQGKFSVAVRGMGVLWRGSKEGGPSSKIFGWSGKDFFNFIFLDASPSQETLPKNSQKNMFVHWICKPVETFVFRFFMALVIGLSTTSASLSCSNFYTEELQRKLSKKTKHPSLEVLSFDTNLRIFMFNSCWMLSH